MTQGVSFAGTDAPFNLLSEMLNNGLWLPPSEELGSMTDVEPHSVRRGSRYHDRKPDQTGEDWRAPSQASNG